MKATEAGAWGMQGENGMRQGQKGGSEQGHTEPYRQSTCIYSKSRGKLLVGFQQERVVLNKWHLFLLMLILVSLEAHTLSDR